MTPYVESRKITEVRDEHPSFTQAHEYGNIEYENHVPDRRKDGASSGGNDHYKLAQLEISETRWTQT